MGNFAMFDRVNNVEQFLWPGIPSGTITIAVRGFRIKSGSHMWPELTGERLIVSIKLVH